MKKLVYQEPKCFIENFKYTFCPGCGHGFVLGIVAQLIDEFGLQGDTIAVSSVGCSIFLEKFFNLDVVGASHGRSPCVATGVKRSKPDKFVFTYQGDGDALTIGFNETCHTALRGEKITTICINNTNFGMTGGQASATSLPGQKTKTTPFGRDVNRYGYPIKAAEMIASCDGAAFVARCAVGSHKFYDDTKKIIRKAFLNQINNIGYSFVEVLSSCPTNWGMSPIDANKHIVENVAKYYKLGVFKDITNEMKCAL